MGRSKRGLHFLRPSLPRPEPGGGMPGVGSVAPIRSLALSSPRFSCFTLATLNLPRAWLAWQASDGLMLGGSRHLNAPFFR